MPPCTRAHSVSAAARRTAHSLARREWQGTRLAQAQLRHVRAELLQRGDALLGHVDEANGHKGRAERGHNAMARERRARLRHDVREPRDDARGVQHDVGVVGVLLQRARQHRRERLEREAHEVLLLAHGQHLGELLERHEERGRVAGRGEALDDAAVARLVRRGAAAGHEVHEARVVDATAELGEEVVEGGHVAAHVVGGGGGVAVRSAAAAGGRGGAGAAGERGLVLHVQALFGAVPPAPRALGCPPEPLQSARCATDGCGRRRRQAAAGRASRVL